MYCTRCGTKNAEESMFCTNCSEPLARRRPTQPASQGETQPPRPYAFPTTPQAPPSSSPYPGYQSSYTPGQIYQPYQSSYAAQPPVVGGSASGRSIASMVLSIIGIAGCGPLTSIPGMILGKVEMNAIKEGRAPKAGDIFAKVGFYLGLVVTVLYCLLGSLWGLLVGIGAAFN